MCDVVYSRTVSTPRPGKSSSNRGYENDSLPLQSFDTYEAESKQQETEQDDVLGTNRVHSNHEIDSVSGQVEGSTQDQRVALEQMRLELEKTIAIFAGARKFLDEQLVETEARCVCAVCQKQLESPRDLEVSLMNLREKIMHTEQVRQESGVLQAYQGCRMEIESLNGRNNCSPTQSPSSDTEDSEMIDQSMLSQSRMICHFRTGSLTELRNQKVECLAAQECFACLRPLSGVFAADFLTLMDRRAAAMEKYLHVHSA